jgi:hypothetical protein
MQKAPDFSEAFTLLDCRLVSAEFSLRCCHRKH